MIATLTAFVLSFGASPASATPPVAQTMADFFIVRAENDKVYFARKADAEAAIARARAGGAGIQQLTLYEVTFPPGGPREGLLAGEAARSRDRLRIYPRRGEGPVAMAVCTAGERCGDTETTTPDLRLSRCQPGAGGMGFCEQGRMNLIPHWNRPLAVTLDGAPFLGSPDATFARLPERDRLLLRALASHDGDEGKRKFNAIVNAWTRGEDPGPALAREQERLGRGAAPRPGAGRTDFWAALSPLERAYLDTLPLAQRSRLRTALSGPDMDPRASQAAFERVRQLARAGISGDAGARAQLDRLAGGVHELISGSLNAETFLARLNTGFDGTERGPGVVVTDASGVPLGAPSSPAKPPSGAPSAGPGKPTGPGLDNRGVPSPPGQRGDEGGSDAAERMKLAAGLAGGALAGALAGRVLLTAMLGVTGPIGMIVGAALGMGIGVALAQLL